MALLLNIMPINTECVYLSYVPLFGPNIAVTFQQFYPQIRHRIPIHLGATAEIHIFIDT